METKSRLPACMLCKRCGECGDLLSQVPDDELLEVVRTIFHRSYGAIAAAMGPNPPDIRTFQGATVAVEMLMDASEGLVRIHYVLDRCRARGVIDPVLADLVARVELSTYMFAEISRTLAEFLQHSPHLRSARIDEFLAYVESSTPSDVTEA